MAKPPFKALSLAPPEIESRTLPGGGLLLRSRCELRPHARVLGEYLRYWASASPSRSFLAERAEDGTWRHVSYAEALDAIERIAASLLARGLDADRPSPSFPTTASTMAFSSSRPCMSGFQWCRFRLPIP
jgi:feruloyl-CoA synthase